MIYTLKKKLSTSKSLETRLNTLANISRFTYNWLLARSIQDKKKKLTVAKCYEYQKEFRALVKDQSMHDRYGVIYEDEWQEILASAPSQISDNECKNLTKAYKTLKKRSIPSFKKARDSRQSFTIHKKVEGTFKYENQVLQVAKLSLRINDDRSLITQENIKLVTISKSSYGWYISVTIEIPDDTFLKPSNGKEVGIDWGVRRFATDSDGYYYSFKDEPNYKKYKTIQARIKALQAKLAKKRLTNKAWKSSKRYETLKEKIAYLYEKLANMRNNFLHHVSKYYLSAYDRVVIEDIKVSNLLKNHNLARSIADSMFYTWKVMLSYKSLWYGKELVIVNPSYTSQTCSSCGHIKKKEDKLMLKEKIYVCKACGYKEDRDLNAAINILNLA